MDVFRDAETHGYGTGGCFGLRYHPHSSVCTDELEVMLDGKGFPRMNTIKADFCYLEGKCHRVVKDIM